MKNNNLDPYHYYASPDLSWNAVLKTSKVQLELLTTTDAIND